MRILSLFAAVVLFTGAALAIVPDEEKLQDAKCPVSGRDVDSEVSKEYKGATIYFCCPNCPPAFDRETTKHAPKANLQLVITEQAEQTNCPISGRPIDPDVTATVSGAEVAFCCPNCQGKVEGAEEEEQITMIFSDASFDEAFEVKKD